MKKIFLGLFILFGSLLANAQVSKKEVTLFAQCMIEISNEAELRALEADIRLNPYVFLVRLDHHTQRAFILTKNVDYLTEDNLISWFNQFSDKVRCVQIGVYGIDAMDSFPFKNCQ